jgi:hypothetical protein
MAMYGIVNVKNLSDLKATPVFGDTIMYMVGRSGMGSGGGGFYWWDETSTEAEETKYLNVVKSDNSQQGRWKRVNLKTQDLPHGVLSNNGGVKMFFTTGFTNASGEVTVNLTMDNTANGENIFSALWFNDAKATVNATTANDIVTGAVKSVSANLKQTTHKFYKGNPQTAILNLSILPATNPPLNTPIQFMIVGI